MKISDWIVLESFIALLIGLVQSFWRKRAFFAVGFGIFS